MLGRGLLIDLWYWKRLSVRFCFRICWFRWNRFSRGRDALASWVAVPRAVELERSRLGEEGLDCGSSDWVLLEQAAEPNNKGNRILTWDSCREVAGWSVDWIGVFVKDWRNLSTNGFGGWFGKATGEIGEEEERRVIISGSVGNLKSSGDKCWSQSIPFNSKSSSSCSRKGSGWSSEI